MKNVKKFKYPAEVTSQVVLKGLLQSKISMIFHALMAVLLVTGLTIDLLGAFLGGWLAPIRSLVHGYIGAVFVIAFPIYLANTLVRKKMRMLMTTVNYIDFALYAVLIVSGIAIASANQPWVNLLPWLSVLSPLRAIAPPLHVIITYVWLVISMVFPGGFLHGVATSYLVWIYRGKNKKQVT